MSPNLARMAAQVAKVSGGTMFAMACLVHRAHAWTASGSTNDELVNNLKRDGVITSPEVEAVMRKLDRANYVKFKEEAYMDSPSQLGHGVTISAPHMHGHALERLRSHLVDRPGVRALDVGCGSGYLTAAMALLAGPEGRVFGIDRVDDLVFDSERNVYRDQGDELGSQLSFSGGDGWTGLKMEGPYDAIHVGAAADTVPKALVSQLKKGGRMIIPVGKKNQELLEVDKAKDGTITQRSLMGVRYVTLVKPEGKSDL
mmetsp:Transcript_103383/g.183200  ORF Transcript_103383/g.183200 Transcript_103383/m.183200 type:complete len:257 (+) Transcript_103383:60-830(+)